MNITEIKTLLERTNPDLNWVVRGNQASAELPNGSMLHVSTLLVGALITMNMVDGTVHQYATPDKSFAEEVAYMRLKAGSTTLLTVYYADVMVTVDRRSFPKVMLTDEGPCGELRIEGTISSKKISLGVSRSAIVELAQWMVK